jgi:hypothetical protein
VNASPYRTDQADAINRLKMLAPQYGSIADAGAAGVNKYDPQYGAAVTNRVDYLQNDPYTTQRNAADLAQTTNGVVTGYNAARARLRANLAQQGIGGGVAAGAEAGIENARAGQMANASNDLYYHRVADADQRSQQLADFLGSVRQMYAGQQQQGLQGQAGVLGSAADGYGGLAQADETRQAQNNQGIMQLIQSLSAAGGAYGNILGMARKSQPTTFYGPQQP